MVTGVVSIALALLDMRGIAWALLIVNWIAYPSLWGLTIVRVAAFRRELARDISDHQRAPGFFTLVADGSDEKDRDARIVATLLWWFGFGLWLVVMYGFFTAVTIRARKPSLAAGINGAWLIGAVATQSIVVLRGALDAGSTPPEPIQFIVLMMFMIGSMLYLAIIPLIFYRLTFVSRRSSRPTHHMGAVAISTLAGATLILRAEHWPLIKPFLPVRDRLYHVLLVGGDLVDPVPADADGMAISVEEGPAGLRAWRLQALATTPPARYPQRAGRRVWSSSRSCPRSSSGWRWRPGWRP